MKYSTLMHSSLGIALFFGGYFLAHFGFEDPSVYPEAPEAHFSKQPAAGFKPSVEEGEQTPIFVERSFVPVEALAGLTHREARVRILTLFNIWQHDAVATLAAEIDQLRTNDTEGSVRNLADWMLTDQNEHSYPVVETPVISDYDNPDDQIHSVLSAQPKIYHQSLENPDFRPDFLDQFYELPENEQLEYIKDLAQSHDDTAIDALNHLILDPDAAVQKAAIDELIRLLEDRTGHFEVIAEHLKQHVFFLDANQTVQLEFITEAAGL